MKLSPEFITLCAGLTTIFTGIIGVYSGINNKRLEEMNNKFTQQKEQFELLLNLLKAETTPKTECDKNREAFRNYLEEFKENFYKEIGALRSQIDATNLQTRQELNSVHACVSVLKGAYEAKTECNNCKG